MSAPPEGSLRPRPGGDPGARSLAVRCTGVSVIYDADGESLAALTDVDLRIDRGESVALFGPSGSGKSTLLTLLAGLQRPSRGEVRVGEDELGGLSERALLRLRGERVGIVLQNPGRSLLPYGTVEDNIRFAQRGVDRSRRRDLPSPADLLSGVGLSSLAGGRVARLSGGEQQRLSIAVAMAASPGLLLADEPTSQLDAHNRDLAVAMLRRIHAEAGTTLVVVTHDPVVAAAMGRRVVLGEGRILSGGVR